MLPRGQPKGADFTAFDIRNRRIQQCREYKLQLLIGGTAALFCLVFVLPWVSWMFGGDDEPLFSPPPPPTPLSTLAPTA